jgi:hypothetical protein
MVDVETIFTDYEWNETSRPILAVNNDLLSASLHVGVGQALQNVANVEITAKTTDDLLAQIEGHRDIFAAAAEWMKNEIQQRKGGGTGV